MTKNIDWSNLGFGYIKTDYRFVSNYKNGSWDEGELTSDENIVLNESAGVLQYIFLFVVPLLDKFRVAECECANFAGERVKLACKPSAKLFCEAKPPP